MKKGYIRAIGECSNIWQLFWIFTDNVANPITTHYCSNEWYAEYDLLRHHEVKEFDVVYWLKWNVVYMNQQIQQSVKDKFNNAENAWRSSKYWAPAPQNHTV